MRNLPSANGAALDRRLMSGGQVLGEVTISSGSPSWMIMDVDTGKVSGVVWCEVTFANRRSKTVGSSQSLTATDHGSRPLASGSDVRSAHSKKANGAVVAQATFTT